MTPNFPLYLIPLLPLIGAAITLVFGKRLGKTIVSTVALGSVLGSMLFTWRAVSLLYAALPAGGRLVDTFFTAPWIKSGDMTISASLVLDNLSAVLCLIITGIGFLIHIYSTAYMEHEERYTRFFGFLNLFMGAMLILVLGDSLPVTFIGWEGVGLCSYLLIGFYFEKSNFAYAGRKAFVVNRIGDFGLLLAMFLIFAKTGTLKYDQLSAHTQQLQETMWLGYPAAYFIGLFVLLGAMGKSAQIPLYVWLPDAMAGPTPVSALIHAATMVTAGVYLVARMHIVFEIHPATLAAVAWVGAITALFAATIGFAQRDLKKVLAYSTVSQLGFMFVGVGSYMAGNMEHAGTSNYDAGIFHLLTHAFFKAGLFLGAGSVMHAMSGEGDIWKMGGLRKHLPHTHATFLLYCFAIAGIPPFAGFWSKDAILGGAWNAKWPLGPDAGGLEKMFALHGGQALYLVLLLAAMCTSFYMFRLYFLVFWGKFRGTHDQEHHLHESPPAMTIPLWILAIGSCVVGFLGVPESLLPESLHHLGDLLPQWLSPVVPTDGGEESAASFLTFAGIATMASIVAIVAAWFLYGREYGEGLKKEPSATIDTPAKAIRNVVANKYYVDELYDFIIVRPIKMIAYVLWKIADSLLIDGVVNAAAWIVGFVGKIVKAFQNGDVQRYVVGVIAGAAIVLVAATQYTVRKAADFDFVQDGSNVRVVAHGKDLTLNAGRLHYRIKWEASDADFTKEQASTTFQHRYDVTGDKKITVEAIDPRWNTKHSVTRTVTVN
jgi:NADH-quinone oxidoreductase subunit L